MKFDLGWTKANFNNILWHAGVVALAAVLTYLLEVLKTADFGEATPFVTMGISWLLKTGLEFIRKA